MAKKRDPFLRALDVIRTNMLKGVYPPAQPIVIADEARRLGLSTTPIREALSCLCGEGLVERGPCGGFVAPRFDAGALRDRYEFRLTCLLAALDLTADLPGYRRRSRTDATAAPDLRRIFEDVVRRSGNAVLLAAYQRVGVQLRQVLEAERIVFIDVDVEADRIKVLADEGAPQAFCEALRTYHHRRIRAAPHIAAEIARRGAASAHGVDEVPLASPTGEPC